MSELLQNSDKTRRQSRILRVLAVTVFLGCMTLTQPAQAGGIPVIDGAHIAATKMAAMYAEIAAGAQAAAVQIGQSLKARFDAAVQNMIAQENRKQTFRSGMAQSQSAVVLQKVTTIAGYNLECIARLLAKASNGADRFSRGLAQNLSQAPGVLIPPKSSGGPGPGTGDWTQAKCIGVNGGHSKEDCSSAVWAKETNLLMCGIKAGDPRDYDNPDNSPCVFKQNPIMWGATRNPMTVLGPLEYVTPSKTPNYANDEQRRYAAAVAFCYNIGGPNATRPRRGDTEVTDFMKQAEMDIVESSRSSAMRSCFEMLADRTRPGDAIAAASSSVPGMGPVIAELKKYFEQSVLLCTTYKDMGGDVSSFDYTVNGQLQGKPCKRGLSNEETRRIYANMCMTPAHAIAHASTAMGNEDTAEVKKLLCRNGIVMQRAQENDAVKNFMQTMHQAIKG